MSQNSDSFRDSIATVSKEGKRIWVYPKKPSGRFYNWRKIVAYTLLAFLFIAPHIKFRGEPLLLFNFIERKFIIFGNIFWPQDFFIFAIAMITAIIFIVVFTIIYGRIFCGWVCPQTIFMEMVFRKIEYWIEGDWTKQKKLNKQPWNREKIFKKTLKHVIFFAIAFIVANTFLAYIVGADELWKIQLDNPMNHLKGLVGITFFSLLFYGVFAFLREQVCTTICPYGRLQGVLLDEQSIVVAYDFLRGEGEKGRAPFRKNQDRKLTGYGDCIDCKQCVHVCPTGIDIRNGTQLECINCTACIDACDSMMDKVGFDRGLIRYDSIKGIKTGKSFRFTSRDAFYSTVLVLLLGALGFLLVSRSDFDVTITRSSGTTQRAMDDDKTANFYDIAIVNKTRENYDVDIKLDDKYKGEIKVVGGDIKLPKESLVHGKFVLILDKAHIKPGKNTVYVYIYGNGKRISREKVIFLGPLL